MEEWKEYRLGDIIAIKSGFAYKGDLIGHGENILLGMGCVSFKERFLLSGARAYAGDCADRYCANSGDIVLATRQQSDNLPILGMPAMIPNELSEKRIIIGANLYRVDNKSDFSNEYIYWLLKTPFYVNHIRSCQSGTTVRMITKANIEDFRFKAPDREERGRISSFLKSLDDKIEVNRRINDNFVIEPFFEILLIWAITTLINDNLEQQAQALFKSWFVDFEPFRDQTFKESELGMIPNGWHAAVLDELCSFISRGLTPKYDENSDELILGQTCVRNNVVTLDNARKHKPKQRTEKWVQQWDTLINSTGVGSLGRVGIAYFDMDNVAIDSHITVVRPKSALVRHYVGRNLLNRQLEIENMAVGSTGQTELPKERVKSLPIMLPDEISLIRFNAIIEPIAYQLYRNIEESRRLACLRDALLPRLMSGELTIADL